MANAYLALTSYQTQARKHRQVPEGSQASPCEALEHFPDHRSPFPTAPGPQERSQLEQKEHWRGGQESRFGSELCLLWASVSSCAPPPAAKVGGDDGKAVLFCQMILIFPFPTIPN